MNIPLVASFMSIFYVLLNEKVPAGPALPLFPSKILLPEALLYDIALRELWLGTPLTFIIGVEVFIVWKLEPI